MKTPYLLHVPKTGPTRRERLKEFKKKHRIFTHDCHQEGYEWRWSAALLNESLQFSCYCKGEANKELPDAELFFILVQHTCRLMDESSLMISAPTEMEALRILCQENKIEFPF